MWVLILIGGFFVLFFLLIINACVADAFSTPSSGRDIDDDDELDWELSGHEGY